MIKAIIAIAMLGASPASVAGGVGSGKFVIVINACKEEGKCEEFRWPIDVVSLLQCQRSGTFAVTSWSVSHPAFKLKSWRCAKADEIDL